MIIPLEEHNLSIDLEDQRLWRGRQEITLTPKSFALLRYLVEHRDKLVSRQDLFDSIWPGVYVVDEALRYQIRELRSALGDNAQNPRFIETVRGRGYRFIGRITIISAQTNPASSPIPRQLSPAMPVLPGRTTELRQLRYWLNQASTGERRIGFINGEPGIGKTTLLNTFLCALDDSADDYWVASGHCVEFYGVNEAYLPLLDALEQLCRGPDRDYVLDCLNRYAPAWLLQLPEFTSDRETLERRTQGSGRERMLREFAQVLEVLSQKQTLILCLEDLHWADSATLEQLAYLAQRPQPARLLIIGSYRPVDAHTGNQALLRLVGELRRHDHCAEQALSLLDVAATTYYLQDNYPGLPDALTLLLQRRSDGNPLFLLNLIDYLQSRNLIIPADGNWHFTGDLPELESELPDALRHLIEQRLAQLDADEQLLLQVASAAGFSFAAEALAAGMQQPVELVETQCARLVQRSQFLRASGEERWPDGTLTARYEFIHALYQETLHQCLTPTRRMRLHQQIGERLERGYQTQITIVAAELARHFEHGRDHERAVSYFAQAAELAKHRHAYQETIDYIDMALNLLEQLPDNQLRARREISLQNILAATLAGVGFVDPRIKQAYLRALELCRQWDESELLFHTLRSSYQFFVVRAEFRTGREIAEQCLKLAQQLGNTTHIMEAHCALGDTLPFCGQLTLARHHLEQCLVLYDDDQHNGHTVLYDFNPKATTLSILSEVLWLQGFPQQAVDVSRRALLLAQQLEHPPTQLHTIEESIRLYIRRRENATVLKYAHDQQQIANDYGLDFWRVIATSWIHWALADQGQIAQNLLPMHRAFDEIWETGALMLFPFCYGLSAELCNRMQRHDQGLTEITKALQASKETGEHWHDAELYRLRGELLLSQGDPDAPAQAEACFQQSLCVARQQEAKSWELRTATSLARLWRDQGKILQAHELLEPVYSWFTEGFDTLDLQEAKRLLSELA